MSLRIRSAVPRLVALRRARKSFRRSSGISSLLWSVFPLGGAPDWSAGSPASLSCLASYWKWKNNLNIFKDTVVGVLKKITINNEKLIFKKTTTLPPTLLYFIKRILSMEQGFFFQNKRSKINKSSII